MSEYRKFCKMSLGVFSKYLWSEKFIMDYLTKLLTKQKVLDCIPFDRMWISSNEIKPSMVNISMVINGYLKWNEKPASKHWNMWRHIKVKI